MRIPSSQQPSKSWEGGRASPSLKPPLDGVNGSLKDDGNFPLLSHCGLNREYCTEDDGAEQNRALQPEQLPSGHQARLCQDTGTWTRTQQVPVGS